MRKYEDIEIGRFESSKPGDFVLVRVVTEGDGEKKIDIRTFYDHGNKPTKKGVRLKLGEIRGFTELLMNTSIAIDQLEGK